ncbi:translation initiation factor IF-2 [Inquilinus limosus]|uniref:translation initiation factor IF-2 n=1 Tax=Inquilinus limosus TaxID=171674 RepID=UPI000416C8A2|nr:translation initiation factor IF-2 [Inquilinus limosus]
MTDSKEQDRKTLSLGSAKPKLTLGGKPADSGQVRQQFSHGRSKAVTVEVKRQRGGTNTALADGGAAARRAAEGQLGRGPRGGGGILGGRVLSQAEREARQRALQEALREEEARRHQQPAPAQPAPQLEPEAVEPTPEPAAPLDPEALRRRELEELAAIESEAKRKAEEERFLLEEEQKRRDAERVAEEARRKAAADRSGQAAAARGLPEPAGNVRGAPVVADDEEDTRRRGGGGRGPARGPAGRGAAPGPAKRAPGAGKAEPKRRSGKLTVVQALSDDGSEIRGRSLAAMRRARERERLAMQSQNQEKIAREVVIPEVITVQELANRMAERGGDVVKTLMRLGVMATITQSIDADTAELVVSEFGHKPKRVAESDVEIGLRGDEDRPEELQPRPPVVTIMGHVDHGKTSLLDALRHTDVVSGEAGGITQHIGAYQVQVESGDRVTFIDTPGHAAFTEMRARGANTTDIVVLVVAANDGVMPQTIEAIRHARAAEVPIIVAINKIDLPDARPERVRTELLQHEVVVEEMGGETLDVLVSAKTGQGLDKLVEAILLQAEVLDLKANPDRPAEGTVIEAKLERGRGSVATVLVQRGTLKVGDIFVTGGEWGRVRALLDDRGQNLKSAAPAQPVEVLGLNGTPLAGDDFIVVDSEARAREITEFRTRKRREAAHVATARGSLEQMFEKIREGEAKELPVIIKGDVQGSVEAIAGSLEKAAGDNAEVKVRVLHSAVGAITESDVTLAASTGAMLIGFNVRANPQAREMAKRDGVEIRYYSIIYNVIDDVKAALTGLLAPKMRENYIGNAEIREVFNITKVGKVAGCMVTNGIVKRGAGVRLLRDNVVIHEGTLKTLKRFKDEVREVREGYECGMAFENYDDIRAGDVIECFELVEEARAL